jgi:hypothetical protein
VTETPKPSEQLPEEGPAEYGHDDGGKQADDESPGAHGDDRTATGNPDAAGSDEGDADQEDPAGA